MAEQILHDAACLEINLRYIRRERREDLLAVTARCLRWPVREATCSNQTNYFSKLEFQILSDDGTRRCISTRQLLLSSFLYNMIDIVYLTFSDYDLVGF